ncbi:MAG: hypothetical protein ACI8X3_002494, partial [Saprospiraceae bacterium]
CHEGTKALKPNCLLVPLCLRGYYFTFKIPASLFIQLPLLTNIYTGCEYICLVYNL